MQDFGSISNEIPIQSATEVDIVSDGINDILNDIRDDPILKQLHAEVAQDASVAKEQIVTKQSSFADKQKQKQVCVCVCLFTNQAFFFY